MGMLARMLMRVGDPDELHRSIKKAEGANSWLLKDAELHRRESKRLGMENFVLRSKLEEVMGEVAAEAFLESLRPEPASPGKHKPNRA